jgi:CRP-like cAMP-binding protein
VKGEMVDFTGKTIKIEDIESPRPLAPAFLFATDNNYPVDIVANNKVSILGIPRKDFLKLMSINEMVLLNYLRIISSRAQFLSGKLRFLSFQSIKGKIAHYLLELSSRTGKEDIQLRKSQVELAELFGVARPSLARALREMNNDGLLKSKGKQITLLNRQKLSDLLK